MIPIGSCRTHCDPRTPSFEFDVALSRFGGARLAIRRAFVTRSVSEGELVDQRKLVPRSHFLGETNLALKPGKQTS